MRNFRRFFEAEEERVNPEEGFRRKLLQNPNDNTVVNAYHDWLEDRGDPRAVIIRLVWELAKNSNERRADADAVEELQTRLKARGLALINALYHQLPVIAPWLRAHPHIQQELEDINAEWLRDALPHGSGIDGTWRFEQQGDNIICTNYYHAMDQGGGYCGTVDFTVTIPINNPLEFDIEVSQDDIDAIMAQYEPEPPPPAEDDEEPEEDYDDDETNAPYLDDLGDMLHQNIYHHLQMALTG